MSNVSVNVYKKLTPDVTELHFLVLPETSPSLLVHFSSGSDSVNCHEENLTRLNHSEQDFDVVKYVFYYLFLRYSEKNGLKNKWKENNDLSSVQ
jgi:hypothetical protein